MNASPVFNHRGLATLAVVLAGTLILAGCGSSDSGSSSSDTSSSAADSGYSYGDKYGGGSASDSSGTSASGNESGSASGADSGAATTVATADVGKFGRILVNSDGVTVYMFEKDKGGKSSCYGACAQAWPPVLTESGPTAGSGAEAAKLGTTKRKDGTTQVTYGGWPLYLYVADTKPGDATGNNIDQFGAEWYVLKPDGEKP